MTSLGKQLLINLHRAIHRALDRKHRCAPTRAGSEPVRELCVQQHSSNGAAQCFRVADRDDETRLFMLDHLRHATHVGGDDRLSEHERIDQDAGRSFQASTAEHDHACRCLK